MEKKFSFLAVALSAALTVTGFTAATPAFANDSLKVGVVTDEGGAKDKSFNQSNVEAVEAWVKSNNGKALQAIETKSHDKIAPNLETASKVSDVVSIAGFYFEKELPAVADKYKDKKYILLDAVVDKENVSSVTFQENETAYLAGYAAALQSKTGKLGFVGGAKIPAVEKFGIGFVEGAKAANKDIEIFYQYSGSFTDAAKGKTLAATMYDQGADIIFAAAGGTGTGVIKEAQERATNDLKSGDIKHWVVGVDKDQYEEGLFKAKDKDGKDVEKSVILTSAVKRIDVAVTKVLDEIKSGSFKGGESNAQVLSIKDNGVGLPEKNPNLTEETTKKVNEVVEELKSGKVKLATKADEVKDKSKVNGEL
ncbi:MULTISPECIES: BMP family protein [unclassified Gemella]|uniref:BMP family lipoprotein n=1 Tax=unclassified Gemella TaxID=2624949 RepID=UPI0015CFC89A|nr:MULTISPECIES: BMP family ABC transporter substrate-binding protein [unclassified Gemella]MBF0710735.1 BMP family ABC transporter substrate-binding protein [Gemella sp. GL1.1]NYS28079.1 BMP family ABC transporter substrate-binding protein [Gemella sp. GL1]